MTRVAAIDCGTNSIRLLVADVDGGDLVDVDRGLQIVRLGRGVDRTGRLDPAAIERTRVALADYAGRIERLGVERVRMVATSASRDAANRDDFHAMVRDTLGRPAEVISGDEEAALSFDGAVRGLDPAAAPYLVVDIGGGSTEFVLGDAAGMWSARSVDVGCVRLTERHLRDDPPRPDQIAAAEDDVRAALDLVRERVPVDRERSFVGLAGSVTTVAALALGLPAYDATRDPRQPDRCRRRPRGHRPAAGDGSRRPRWDPGHPPGPGGRDRRGGARAPGARRRAVGAGGSRQRARHSRRHRLGAGPPMTASSLRLDTLTVPTADLGPVNPLPPLTGPTGPTGHEVQAPFADAEMAANIGYGRIDSVLPYLVQDGYTRDRWLTDHPVAVLENDVLRATFLLDHGGRLWSLLHRPTGRELLHRNPVLQPANLALRNAWFAGGVEWNTGATGHTPLTCAPVHAARITRPDGTPALRCYEWERIRGLVYCVEAWLPPGSPVLLVHVRLVNPHRHETPAYWWSNTAVPQAPDVRVICPAESAYHLGDDRRLRTIPVPDYDGLDVSYPGRARHAADYFFDARASDPRWIAALDGGGTGLAQVSTGRLTGRKLFVWGGSTGGRHWQEFLSGPDAAYFEIQAGLARTQLEHLRMPGGARWSWVEAYGLLRADPRRVHGPWQAARRAVGTAVDALAPQSWLESSLAEAERCADDPPEQILHAGSGVGGAGTPAARGGARGTVGRAGHAVPGQHPRRRAGTLGAAAGHRMAAGGAGRRATRLLRGGPRVATAARTGARPLAELAAPRRRPLACG